MHERRVRLLLYAEREPERESIYEPDREPECESVREPFAVAVFLSDDNRSNQLSKQQPERKSELEPDHVAVKVAHRLTVGESKFQPERIAK